MGSYVVVVSMDWSFILSAKDTAQLNVQIFVIKILIPKTRKIGWSTLAHALDTKTRSQKNPVATSEWIASAFDISINNYSLTQVKP
jgi:hypothetical protein